MTHSIPICLRFSDPVSEPIRARVTYAFRVFAAIYGHPVVEGESNGASKVLLYGSRPSTEDSNQLHVPARYTPAVLGVPRPAKLRFAGDDFCVFHGVDPASGRPDWLGEIFTWLSSSLEYDIAKRDSIGCVPDTEMIFSRAGLNDRKPQAAMHMAWLEHCLQNAGENESLPRAPSPLPETEHLVVCSHDVDFCFTNRLSALTRIVKNLGISWLVYKSPSYFKSSVGMLGKWTTGERVGDYIPALMTRLEQHQSHSTFFIVPVHSHRRDPDYTLKALVPQIQEARKRGFAVEIHGSYQSIIENRSLLPEKQALQQATGRKALGSRQHWLRFDTHSKLFEAIEESELLFDSSLGFRETVGFRNGACFAFPPYDFEKERPYPFLEIPLVIMDGALVEQAGTTGETPQELAEEVLTESRKRGWGGVSVLWHNPMEALSVPEEVNQVFWNCLEARKQNREKWLSTDQFLALTVPRYQRAGLLQGAAPDKCADASFR